MALDIMDILGDRAGTSTKSVVGTLFGTSPDVVASQIGQQNLASTQQTAMAYAQMDPMQRAQYAMFQGAAGGTGGLLQAVGAENPQITRAKQGATLQQQISQLPLDTVEGQKQAMDMALQAGRPEIAIQLRDVFLKQGKTQADIEKARRVDTSETVDMGLYEAAKRDAGGDPIKAAQLYNERRQAEKRNVAAAGAAQYGGEKIANLSGAQNIVEGYTKKPMERLQAIGEAQTFLGQSGVNPAAVPQLRRALVKLGGGDSQVAQREVQQIAGSMGIAGNVSEAVNQFFTGKPSAEQLKLVGQVVKAAETYYADQYTKGRTQAENVLGAAKLDPQTRAALLPPEYKLATPKAKKSISFSDLPQ